MRDEPGAQATGLPGDPHPVARAPGSEFTNENTPSRRFRLEFDVHLPFVAERLLLAAGRELALNFAVFEFEVAHLHLTDGTEPALLEPGMLDLAAHDLPVLIDGDNEGTAILAERGAGARILVLGVILLRKNQDNRRLVAQRFAF